MDLMNHLGLQAEQHSRKFRHGGWRQPAAFTMASHGHHGTSANSWTYQPVFFQNPQQYSSLYKTSMSNLEALGCSEHPGAPQGVPDKLHMEIPSQLFQDLIISAWRSKDFFFFTWATQVREALFEQPLLPRLWVRSSFMETSGTNACWFLVGGRRRCESEAQNLQSWGCSQVVFTFTTSAPHPWTFLQPFDLTGSVV